MLKKMISLVLVALLVCALGITAAGCKGSSGDKQDSAFGEGQIPGGVADVSEEVLQALSESGNVLVYTNSKEPSQHNKDREEYFSNVYGGTLESRYVEWEGWEKVFITDFAADDAPDVISLFYKLWPKAPNRGMVYSIDELEEMGVVGLDHPVFDDDIELCKKNYTYKGQVYSLGVTFKSAVYCLVNTDLFEKYSVKSPIDYFNEGTWNYANFVKCTKELTRDSNNDDVLDIHGYTGWDLSWFVVANGGQLVRMDDKGVITEHLDDFKVNNALKNIYQLASVDKCVVRNADAFYAGKVGMYAALKTNISKPIGNKKVTFNWDVVPFPYGPDNAEGGVMPGDINGQAIVTSTENAQGALNYIIACRVFAQMTEGMYDDEFLSVFSEEQHQMMADYDNQTANAFFMGVGSLWHAQWDFWTALSGGKGTVSEILATYQPMFKQQCDLEMDSAN